MRIAFRSLVGAIGVCLLAGCLATPVERTGGPGSITVPNTNPQAIVRAAQTVFPGYGYSLSQSNFPTSISFDRPAGRMGTLAFGGWMDTTSIRVRLEMVPISGSNDFRLRTQVYRVNNAGVAGFERDTRMLRVWSAQFNAILRQIKADAANAGPL
ncbi:MAG: hypothetical protein IAE94_02750 [Chthoniobacterales bacterium]|nr:hypothetical protein [Chthoniobacterales bacterium]